MAENTKSGEKYLMKGNEALAEAAIYDFLMEYFPEIMDFNFPRRFTHGSRSIPCAEKSIA